MFTELQILSLMLGTVLVLAGFSIRGLLVTAMRRSDYYDYFSYLGTWVLVSPALFIGFTLMWLSLPL